MARVVLRAPTAEDCDEFIARMRASRALHRPWIYMPETRERYAAYLTRTEDPRAAPYLACRTEDGAIVGFLNISEIVRGGFKSAFLGYGGVADFAGQGYMTEAMRLLLREAFTTVGLHRLEANIQPGNHASIALAKRCGFELEGFSPRYLKVGGRWRDHERWAIREETWRAGRTSTAAG
jgi:[ribosomal protein S5]-alanine N-acetyltransferase